MLSINGNVTMVRHDRNDGNGREPGSAACASLDAADELGAVKCGGLSTNCRLAQKRPGPSQPNNTSGIPIKAPKIMVSTMTRPALSPASALTAPTMPGCGGTSECVTPRLKHNGKMKNRSDCPVSRC